MERKAKLLVVDDDCDLCEIILGMIEHAYEVKTANNGNEANQLLQQEHFDLVISDYKMPGLTGANLAKKHPNTKFLIITGMTHKPASIKHYEILSKPLSAQTLLNRISKILTVDQKAI